jgi:hypothetical protein
MGRLRRRPDLPSGMELEFGFVSHLEGGVAAAPSPVVAQHLDQPLEAVVEAAREVEPYYTVTGEPKWSVHLIAIELGLRRSRASKGRRPRDDRERDRDRQRREQARLDREELLSALTDTG